MPVEREIKKRAAELRSTLPEYTVWAAAIIHSRGVCVTCDALRLLQDQDNADRYDPERC